MSFAWTNVLDNDRFGATARRLPADLGGIIPMSQVQTDSSGRQFIVLPNGRRSYSQPIGFDASGNVTYDPSALARFNDSGGMFHNASTWNAETGQYDEGRLNWGAVIPWLGAAAMGAYAAPAVIGGLGGSATAGGATAATGGTGAATAGGATAAAGLKGLTLAGILANGGTSLLGNYLQTRAANNAADIQANSANRSADISAKAAADALAFQKEQEAERKREFEMVQAKNFQQYQDYLARLAPYRSIGLAALGKLSQPIGKR